jgi:methionyl aminopeptidase
VTIETEADVIGLRVVGRVVASCMHAMAQAMKPGMTTRALDAIGEEFLARAGAVPAPRSTYGFPGATCISVNEAIAHGLPGELVLAAGDIVNIDVSASIDGYFADTGGSFTVGAPTKAQKRVCDATKEALAAAMQVAVADAPLSDIGRAVERVAKRRGLRVVKQLCSHGVGRALHEDPGTIPSYYDPRDRRVLHEGLVITIEPFLTTGRGSIVEDDDGWTLRAAKGTITAQYEHTMIIGRGPPEIVTIAA